MMDIDSQLLHVNLTAPTTGPPAGFVIMGDPHHAHSVLSLSPAANATVQYHWIDLPAEW